MNSTASSAKSDNKLYAARVAVGRKRGLTQEQAHNRAISLASPRGHDFGAWDDARQAGPSRPYFTDEG